MNQRDYTLNVKIGDTVYINTRSKRVGQSAVVLEKGSRSSLLKFEDGHKQWFTFYSIEREPVTGKVVVPVNKGLKDTLRIDYEEFPEEGTTVLTVSRRGEALHMLHGDNAEITYNLLLGTLEDAIRAIREENEE